MTDSGERPPVPPSQPTEPTEATEVGGGGVTGRAHVVAAGASASPPRKLLAALLAGLLVVIAATVAVFVLSRNSTESPDGSPGGPEALQPGWQRRGSIANPRDDFGTLVIDGKIWIGGGMTGERGNKLSSTEWYDPAKDRWSVGVRMPTARSSLGVAYLDGVIYAIGGATSERPHLAVNEVYDVATSTWSGRTPMPTARYEVGTVVLDGKIWVIGGKAVDGPTGVVEIYDPATDTWSEGPPLRVPRSSLRAAVLDGKIYAVGGLIEGGSVPVVEVYDPAVGAWQDGPSIPTPLSNVGMTVFDNQIHVIYHQYHYVLGVGATRWVVEEAPTIRRHGLGMAQVGDALFAIGGCTEEPLVDVNIVQAWIPPEGSVTRTMPPDQAAAQAVYVADHPSQESSSGSTSMMPPAMPLADDE